MQDEWLDKFRSVVLAYNKRRIADPFMEWYREQDRKGLFANDFERILVVLIDARFDQQTVAENALENTKSVFQAGALKGQLERNGVPLLIPRQRMTAENWTEQFSIALPWLHKLAAKIEEQKIWSAEELLDLMRSSSYRVPYLGIKTSRLAGRWLHELVPYLSIDMSDFKIPIDILVYRVASRLEIIDPHVDRYYGEASPADVKIQSFAKTLFPDDPWFLDESLWSTGRRAIDGGHCFPTYPDHQGCMFDEICPKKFVDFDPSKMGMEPDLKAVCGDRGSQVRRSRPAGLTERQRKFSEFVHKLKEQGIKGEEYRRRVTEWFRNNP